MHICRRRNERNRTKGNIEMKTREKIGMHMSPMDIMFKLSEGNPGAINVMGQMLQEEVGFLYILSLDDMNMWGSQIWVGYKDYCGEDIKKFIEAVKNRDPEMVKVVNEQCGDYGHMAVTSGASFKR